MKIIPRKQAIQERLVRYFTGQPCSSGHIAERYTSTATCISCLRPNSSGNANRHRELMSELRDIKIIIHDGDVAAFKTVLVSLSDLNWPGIELGDLLSRARPRFVTVGIYQHVFRAFPVDISYLQQYAAELHSARALPVVSPVPLLHKVPSAAPIPRGTK